MTRLPLNLNSYLSMWMVLLLSHYHYWDSKQHPSLQQSLALMTIWLQMQS